MRMRMLLDRQHDYAVGTQRVTLLVSAALRTKMVSCEQRDFCTRE